MENFQFAKWTTKVPESEIRRLLKYNVKYYFGGGKPGALPLEVMINVIDEILDEQRQNIRNGNEQVVIDQYNYGPTQGLPKLRELLGNRICTKDNVPYAGDNPGDVISCDGDITRTASPDTEISGVCVLVEVTVLVCV